MSRCHALDEDLSICSLVAIRCSSRSDARPISQRPLSSLTVNLERFIAWTCVGAIFAAAHIAGERHQRDLDEGPVRGDPTALLSLFDNHSA
jgi:hypothetical protein